MTEVLEGVRVSAESERAAFVPGAAVIARIRRMVIAAVVAGLIYSFLTVASKGICVGGVDGSGGFIDSSGNPTDAAPSCLILTLGPNPLMLVLFAAIVVLALTRVLNRAQSEKDAVRIIDRSVVAVAVLAALGIVISQIWFGLIPTWDWTPTGSYSFVYPFPFGSVELSITPMTTT
ncbi:hypothetical protein [Herbiconiux sp.]|uniref:hypothetical protein n=1 Tax=Herbiconiux sp. TaxID=1871186 RepID=UPI0025BC1565|nr:hypothetical protein [Herbiconiux sp.]